MKDIGSTWKFSKSAIRISRFTCGTSLSLNNGNSYGERQEHANRRKSKKSINSTDGNDKLLLNILTIVQRIDERLVKQETEIKKIEEIKSSVIAVNKKVREMEELLDQVNIRS